MSDVLIPNPEEATYSKTSFGITDCVYSSGYKFCGASILSVNQTIGYNGTPTSASVTLVEDTLNGDLFIQPVVPSIVAFSLPSGGVGSPIFYPGGIDLNPNGFSPSNVPFYFAGICNALSKEQVNIAGKTINISIVDPREILTGVVCLLNGFALSQAAGIGLPRFDNVDNIIDVFGYYNQGLSSNKNTYGMQWSNIRTAIEDSRVKVNDMNFEFYFTGSGFLCPPSWYRIDENQMDLIGLATKVCADGGSDLITIGRKVDSTTMVVEFRAIPRTNANILTKGDLSGFLSYRSGIVEHASVGIEMKNTPTSNIVVGAPRNSMYLAQPTDYVSAIHLKSGKEDFNLFPLDIKARLFGGVADVQAITTGGPVTSTTINLTQNVGSIFPFWGYSTISGYDPMAEPFLSLDHLVFDKDSNEFINAKANIPLCQILTDMFEVRTVPHNDMFLTGDGEADFRPFGYLDNYIFDSSNVPGYVRGLPLNTEVLRAALISEECFWSIYSTYYPDIASALKLPQMNFDGIKACVSGVGSFVGNGFRDLRSINIQSFMFDATGLQGTMDQATHVSSVDARILKTDANLVIIKNAITGGNYQLMSLIYQQVKQYAQDYMGKRFVVCLPASPIMQRIWAGESVPTNPFKPEIEYIVDDRGYVESAPALYLDITSPSGGVYLTQDQANQVQRRFMMEDTRYLPMAIMDWHPSGNASFHSNGLNKAMFQDFPTSEFRPSRIAEGNPNFVFISCSPTQIIRRPDLAIVDLPNSIHFDPYDGKFGLLSLYQPPTGIENEYASSRYGIIKYLWYHYQANPKCRDLFNYIASRAGYGGNEDAYASLVINVWVDQIRKFHKDLFQIEFNTEPVMDLKGILIPLTSTWISYGPWYFDNTQAKGMVGIDVDNSLVPWNFPRSDPWYANLDIAGQEKVGRSLAVLDYVDNASVTVAGFPEFGLGSFLGYNSNITTISVNFGIDGVKTVYNMATYNARPGTFRKSDYENIAKARVDIRPRIIDPFNDNLVSDFFGGGTNRFPN